MIYRITDFNGFFLRDDFTHDPETEIALDVPPAQGLYRPRWDGNAWIEGATPEEIPVPAPPEPTIEDRVAGVEDKTVSIEQTLDAIFGGTI